MMVLAPALETREGTTQSLNIYRNVSAFVFRDRPVDLHHGLLWQEIGCSHIVAQLIRDSNNDVLFWDLPRNNSLRLGNERQYRLLGSLPPPFQLLVQSEWGCTESCAQTSAQADPIATTVCSLPFDCPPAALLHLLSRTVAAVWKYARDPRRFAQGFIRRCSRLSAICRESDDAVNEALVHCP